MARVLPPLRWETDRSYLRRLAAPATSIDAHLVGLTNVVCQVGIARHGRPHSPSVQPAWLGMETVPLRRVVG